MMRILSCILLLTGHPVWGQAGSASTPQVEFINASKTLPAGLPFSEAVRVGDILFLSGQIGLQPGTMALVSGGIEAETRQTLDGIKRLLESQGLGMEDIVKCTVMLADIGEWGTFNDVYIGYFNPPYPARSAFGASGLALGARVELDCMAVVR